MRLTTLLAASVLAAIAWIACWQEVQLVRLKHQVRAAAVVARGDRGEVSGAQDRARVPGAQPARPEVALHRASPGRVSARAALPSMDRLRTLLAEREQAVADAREAAAQFGIPVGPEMDQAVAFSTADLDQAIVKLIGPDAAAQLAALAEQNVPVAPMTPAPVAPAPIYVNVPPTQVDVNVAASSPTMVAAAPVPGDAGVDESATAYTVDTAGLGWGYVTTGSNRHRRETQLEQLQSLTASAGIPLVASPLAGVVATSPLLLMRQHTAAAR